MAAEYVDDPANLRVDATSGTERPALEATIDRFEDLEDLRARWRETEAMPVLVAERTDAEDNSWGALDIRTFLRGEQSAGRFSTHSVVLAPGAGISPHYHLDAHAYLLVVRGDVELQVGATVEAVGRNSLAYVPPRTRLGVRNRSDAPVTVMLSYSPAGADRAFAEAHAHAVATGSDVEADYHAILGRYGFQFDDEPLVNDARTNDVEPPVELEFQGGDDLERLRQAFFARPAVPRLVSTRPEEYTAEVVDHTLRKHMLTGDDTAGTAMMNLVSLIPGGGAQEHHQPTEEEFFFVLDGPFRVTCGSETKVVEAGALAFAPRNATHGFGNVDPADFVRFCTLNSPAGHERAMAATRKAMVTGVAPEKLEAMRLAGGFVMHAKMKPISEKALGGPNVKTTGI